MTGVRISGLVGALALQETSGKVTVVTLLPLAYALLLLVALGVTIAIVVLVRRRRNHRRPE